MEKIRQNRFGFIYSTGLVAWALAAILIIAAGLRIFMADSFSFWFDEVLTGIDVQYFYKNFFIDRTKVAEFPLWSWDHPPLYFILSKAITGWFGTSELAFRATAIVAGILTIPALYLLGKELFGHRVGLLAALLLAISAFHVRYSQEARPYSLMLFSNVLAYWFLARAMRKSTPPEWSGWLNWIGWIIANLIGVYAHYLTFVALACQAVIAEIARSNRKQLAYLVSACALIAIAYLPWKDNLLQFFAEPLGGGPSTRTLLAELIYRLFVTQFALGYEWLLHVGLLLIVVSLLIEKDRAKQSAILLILGGGFAYLAVFFVDPTSRLMGPRYLLPLLMIWVLLLANAIVTTALWLGANGEVTFDRSWRDFGSFFAKRNLGTLAMGIPLLFAVLYIGVAVRGLVIYYQTPREQFKESAKYIQENMLPGDPVLIDRRHYGYSGVLDYYPRQFGYISNIFAGNFDVEQVAGMCVDKQRAWYWTRIVRNLSDDPVVAWFTANGDCSASQQFSGFLLCSCGEPREAIWAQANSDTDYSTLVRANLNRTVGNWDEATALYLEAIQTDADPAPARQGLRVLGQITGNPKLEIDALIPQFSANPTDAALGQALKNSLVNYFTQNPDFTIADTDSNLISSGGFEEGNLFVVPGNNPPGATFMVDESTARSGKHSLKMEGLTPGGHGGWSAQVRVVGNVPYLFGGYVKTQNVSDLKGRLLYWENNGSTHLGWVNFSEPIDDWTFFWTVALIPADQTVINLRPSLFEGVGSIWIDDLILINLVENVDKIQAAEE